jgi:hypothetical protein
MLGFRAFFQAQQCMGAGFGSPHRRVLAAGPHTSLKIRFRSARGALQRRRISEEPAVRTNRCSLLSPETQRFTAAFHTSLNNRIARRWPGSDFLLALTFRGVTDLKCYIMAIINIVFRPLRANTRKTHQTPHVSDQTWILEILRPVPH